LQPTNNERGFTLIEVLVAMVIMTVALVAMAELMAITLRLQMLGRNETSAVRLVQSKIDQLVAVNFTSAIAGETRVRKLIVTVLPTNTDTRTVSKVELTTIIRDP
jgi:prepilin-type N-terminal cleavage/methylation domain-containing protein